MDNYHNYPSREDYAILNAVYAKTSNNIPRVKRKSVPEIIPEYLDALLRKLAEVNSQRRIAQILNEQGITRPDGSAWKQPYICDYFKRHGIKTAHKWKGTYNPVWVTPE